MPYGWQARNDSKCRADWLRGGGGETARRGEETDGKAGLVPTIPRRDYAGNPPPTV